MSNPLRVGKCIYCGTTEKPLKTEHIIPFGWSKSGSAGDVLLEASCGDCEDITKLFEQIVLRDIFGNIRKVMELRSRSGQLPKTVPQLIRDKKGVEKTIQVPIEELVDVIFLPIFAQPSICEDKLGIKDCVLIEMQTLNLGINSSKETYNSNDTDEVKVMTTFKNKAFEKFLLKIGYCTAVKNFGLEAVENSPIPKILLGFDQSYGTYLGCLPNQFLNSKPDVSTWMQYGSFEVPKGIVSAVKLFAAIEGSPEYSIVILKK